MPPYNVFVGDQATRRKRQRYDSMMDVTGSLEREEFDDVTLPGLGLVHIPVIKGDFNGLPKKVQEFVAEHVSFL